MSSERCLNCGGVLQGPFCHACGQAATARLLSVRELLREGLSDFFDVDGRAWSTVRLLLFRPGALTQAYAEGRRAPYLGPLRVYLVSSALYFLAYALVDSNTFLFLDFNFGEETELVGTLFPRIMFALVPLVPLILRTLFRDRERPYVVDLTYAAYLHAAWYLLFTVSALLDAVAQAQPDGSVAANLATVVQGIMLLIMQIHLYRGLRTVYGKGRLATIVRHMAFLGGYSFLLGVLSLGWVIVLTQVL